MANEKTLIQKEKLRAGWLSVIIGILVFGAKIATYFMTHSAAVYSDTAESVVHILATIFALLSLYYASKPPDKNHPYGHGNIEYFSAGMEGLLIVIAAAMILYEAVNKLIYGVELHNLGSAIFIVLGLVFVNLALGFYLIRKGKKTNSLILEADGKHILTDSFTSAGVLTGLVLVKFTGVKILDPIIALLIGANIIVTGVKLMRHSYGGLMLESNEEILQKIAERLIELRRPFWIDIHELRYFKIAEKIFVDFHLVLPYYFTIRESHEVEEFIREQLAKDFPEIEIKIHMDYCREHMCNFCIFEECDKRKSEKTKNLNWTLDKLISKPKWCDDDDD